jgi:tRNA 2-thiouridine synthesizing protein B
MLHIVNKSPLQSDALASCLRTAREGHTVLLIEDAVYAATAAGARACGLDAACKHLKVHVLVPDLEARGMAARRIQEIAPVDYRGFVELAATHPAIQSWL